MANRKIKYNFTKIYVTKDEMGNYIITDGGKDGNLTNILNEILETKQKVDIRINKTMEF